MSSDFDEAEKPLDPAAERVRKKMVRLLAVSIGVMLVGVMAVLVAVVYKAGAPGPVAESPAAALAPGGEIALALPAGAVIHDLSLDGGRALLRVEEAGEQSLLLLDLSDGSILARYRFGGS